MLVARFNRCVSLLTVIVTVMVTAGTPQAASAQCPPVLQPGIPLPGVDGPVYAMTTWDPDGPGPQLPRTVIGGQFRAAGSSEVTLVAAWNAQTSSWEAVGPLGWVSFCSGTNCDPPPSVLALAALPNGDLVVGGSGFGSASALKRLSGGVWSDFGPINAPNSFGDYGRVSDLLVASNGDLIVAGRFLTVGNTTSRSGVARWNGSVWSAVGDEPPASSQDRVASSLLELPGGELLVGYFSGGGVLLRKWTGSAWVNTQDFLVSSVRSLVRLPNGDVIVGTSGSEPVRRWNGGSTWVGLGNQLSGTTWALAAGPTGELLAAGSFTLNGVANVGLVQWNGTSWVLPAPRVPSIGYSLLTLPNGDVFVGGDVSSIDTIFASNVARLNGGTWTAIGSGVSKPVLVTTALPNGDAVVAGDGYVARSIAGNWVNIG